MSEDEKASLYAQFIYEPTTGRFFHKVDKRGFNCVIKAGDEVKARPNKDGYCQIGFGKRLFSAHRVAWLLTHGEWPDMQIDHIDHNRQNNVISNLRLVNNQGNKRNESRRKDNTSGFTGVTLVGKRWMAYYYLNSKCIVVGYYDTKHEAIAARKAANSAVGFHPNHGTPKLEGAIQHV